MAESAWISYSIAGQAADYVTGSAYADCGHERHTIESPAIPRMSLCRTPILPPCPTSKRR